MSENNPNGHFVFSGPNVKAWIAAGPRCHQSAPSSECLSRVELCGLRAHLFGWTTCNVSINVDIKLLQIGLVFWSRIFQVLFTDTENQVPYHTSSWPLVHPARQTNAFIHSSCSFWPVISSKGPGVLCSLNTARDTPELRTRLKQNYIPWGDSHLKYLHY